MSIVNRSAYVPYSAESVYSLVNDIKNYPCFINGCSSANILEDLDTHMIASIGIKKAGVAFKFTTKNLLEFPSSIEMHLVEGPFKYLTGCWKFDALNQNACKVNLTIDYEFNNKILGAITSKIFDQIANTLIDDICARADTLFMKVE